MARKPMIKLPGFEGIDDSGGGFHITAGEYLMKCASVTEEISKQKNEMLVFKFEGLEKAAKGKSFRLHCTLGANALWKLKQTLRAMGLEVPDDPSELDPDDVIGVECIGIVIDDEFEGRTNSRLAEIRSADSEVVDEKPTKSSSKNGNQSKSTKFAASEVEEMAEDELFEINEKYDLGVPLDSFKTTKKKAGAIIASLQANKMLEA